jgi:HEAT repeat protein
MENPVRTLALTAALALSAALGACATSREKANEESTQAETAAPGRGGGEVSAAAFAIEGLPRSDEKPGADALRSRLLGLLGGEDTAPSPKEIQATGEPLAVLVALEAIARDPAAEALLRSRAVSAMALVDDPVAVKKLAAIALDKSAEPASRRSAVVGLGVTRRKEALETLSSLSKDDDPDVRSYAEKARKKIDGAR